MIDLSQLPAPEVVEPLDFEGIYQDLLATFQALMGDGWTAPLESDPVVKLLELCAYREVQLRARINDAARSVLLAYAVGADLEQLAANVNVSRLLVRPGDPEASPPVDPVYENDVSLRARVQRAFEGLSVAGPRAAYVFHALSADGRVADASAESPAPAEVVVTVLSREGDGSAGADLLDTVNAALSSEEVRPVADRLTVQGAQIVPYEVKATLWLYPGPEVEPILAAALAQLETYVGTQRRLGRDIRRSALFAALHVEGVQRVELLQPSADVVLTSSQAAHCTAIDVSAGGFDE
ncbi:baseplate J/gp47 family protein [Enterobacter roggenkampii]|uniref:baseplate assembly protein n=1 Tax=Enterobacter roggenkampii TaxID=1812935 RepID=UPI00201FEE61|nr:baseplate J/gp47 family protein [Enterobacter roggenkampii]MCL8137840.1 baseplate J/gp47 family protein [Enterobacter roggenkampii]MCM8147542.1 baseplate J/gp47 family protein [Enterobacter roggenkampii]